MPFIADLHIHSHYSVATSKNLVPEQLEYWARLKGIQLLGTGDCLHPGWLRELEEKLAPVGNGFFRLKDDYRLPQSRALPELFPEVQFVLTGEISQIYKRGGRVRKVHNVLFFPDLTSLHAVQRRLMRVGNLESDGRPILGLDSRDLLEMVLESSELSFLIPAHIWTPWFSVLGSKSGFDSVEECFGDLTGEIFAVETGLSSDPPMNWACSFLDPFQLVSNSDAHSPQKLGREANLLDCALDYQSFYQALQGDGLLGTIEFFPQEGKYHYDGHRKCGVQYDPMQTLAHKGICPVCGDPLTKGVMYRVAELADRRDLSQALQRKPYYSITALPDILAEVMQQRSSQNRKVQNHYHELLHNMGPEFVVLLHLPLKEIEDKGGFLLAEAIGRMRRGEIHIQEGYDGEFGRITAFAPDELAQKKHSFSIINAGSNVSSLFGPDVTNQSLAQEPDTTQTPPAQVSEAKVFSDKISSLRALVADSLLAAEQIPSIRFDIQSFQQRKQQSKLSETAATNLEANQTQEINGNDKSALSTLTEAQKAAVSHGNGPALVLAGPGSGKTRVLVARLEYLLATGKISKEKVLAISFTRKSAEEIQERVSQKLPKGGPWCTTFHALGLAMLQQSLETIERREGFVLLEDEDRLALAQAVVGDLDLNHSKTKTQTNSQISRAAKTLLRQVFEIKQGQRELTLAEQGNWQAYQDRLKEYNALDMDDLIYWPQVLLEQDSRLASEWGDRYDWILVDEFQDINRRQFLLLQSLLNDKQNLFAIGDPDQAIYGFRGASSHYIENFTEYFPGAQVYHLAQSFRCPDNVMALAAHALARSNGLSSTHDTKVMIHEAESARAEAEWLASEIEETVGGLRSFSMDSGQATGQEREAGLGDIAILCRTSLLFEAIEEALLNHAIPYQKAADKGVLQREPLGPIIKILRNIYYNMDLSTEMDFVLVQTLLDKMRRKVGLPELIKDLLAQKPIFQPQQITEDPFVMELLHFYGSDYEALFADYAMRYPVEDIKLDTEAVSLLTMHAAKGLEFDYVFLPGIEQGFVPFTLFGDSDELEEERLFYVALTRTKNKLYLSYARTRSYFGRKRDQKPSPFLERFSQELIQYHHNRPERGSFTDSNQLSLF